MGVAAFDTKDAELAELFGWIQSLDANMNRNFPYENNEHHYRMTMEYLYDGKKKRGYNLIIHDHTADWLQEKYLEEIAITDEMTALLNRRAFDDDLAVIEKDGCPNKFVIVSFDLNGLKNTNDTEKKCKSFLLSLISKLKTGRVFMSHLLLWLMERLPGRNFLLIP